MDNTDIAKSYDSIAGQWEALMQDSRYGLPMTDRAIKYCSNRQNALDVGCGSGGRITNTILAAGFDVDGIDISAAMLNIARAKHPEPTFRQADIRDWESARQYDLIVAWDSVFHLPMKLQATVVAKMCGMLRPKGILLYTFGDAIGDHTAIWLRERFSYGSIGITENLRAIAAAGCVCKHLELDQFPEKHVSIIVQKIVR